MARTKMTKRTSTKRRTPKRHTPKRSRTPSPHRVVKRAPQRKRASVPKRKSSARQRAIKNNPYYKFMKEYRATHNLKGVPVPEQGRIIGRAYRQSLGRKSPVRKPRTPKRRRSTKK